MSNGLIFFFHVINSEVLTLAHLENGNIIDNIKKGEITEILYSAIERMNNELCVTVEYELEGCGWCSCRARAPM